MSLTRFGTDERRVNHRYGAPAFEARISGARVVTEDWSLGGALFRGVPWDLGVSPEQTVSGRLDLGDGLGSVDFTGRVVRSNRDNGQVAVEFTNMGERQLEQFAQLFKTFKVTRTLH